MGEGPGLSETKVEADTGGGERLLGRSCRSGRSDIDIAEADRTLRRVGVLEGGRSVRLERFLGVGLCASSLAVTGTFLELRRIGTGNGGRGAVLEPEPLSMLGALGLCGHDI